MNARTNTLGLEELLAHAGWVRGLVRELVKDPARRADVEQETWLAALTSLPAGVRDAKGWLRAVALNVLRQGARGEARRERRERAAARPEAVPSTAELVSQVELQRRIVRAVLELAEPWRSTLLLTFFRGLSCAEIARAEGLPASTVRNRLQRGLAELRERFERELGSADERRRVLGAWLALPAARTATGLSAPAARWLGLVAALVLLGTAGARFLGGSTHSAGAHPAGASPVGVPEARTADERADRPSPVDAAAREPLAAPALAPRATGPRGRVVDEDGGPVAEALVTVAAAARFEAEPVSIGVSARTDSAGAFVLPAELGARAGLVVFAEKEGHVPERAELARGETVIRLRSAATIAGTVVEDGSEAPLAGVRLSSNEFDWRDGAMRETVTDAAGRFTLARVPPGLLSLRLARPGAAFQARRVFVPGLGRHEVRIRLARGASLSGRVVDGETGAGLGDARLVVDFLEVARSADDGSFALEGLARGERHEVELALPGHCTAVLALEAGEAPAEPVLVPLFRECVVEGSVLDETGAPLAFAEVELADGEDAPEAAALPANVRLGSSFWQARATRADQRGRFRLDRLEPWRAWSLFATHPGDARRALGERLVFRAPGERRETSLAFPLADAALAGSVRVNDVAVRARLAWQGATSAGETETDAEGRYELAALEPGPLAFRVEVAERGLELEERLTLARGTSAHDFELHAEQTVLAGFVRRPDGAPVAGQEVRAFSPTRPGPGARGISDASGAFRLWVTAAPGEALTVRARAGVVQAALFPVPAGAEDVRLVLGESGALELRVLAPAGESEPLELEAAWRDASGPFSELPRFALVPLGEGRWRIEVPAGRIELELRAPRDGWAPVRLAGLVVEAGATGAPVLAPFEKEK